MIACAEQTPFSLDDFVARQESKSLLRFIVCGSVDHGKSTLIGRRLYEANCVFEDQLDLLAQESRNHGELDMSLLLDGLAAEREQKITIDVAYRYFTTERRKFVVADAPGHEQYTRNMATGASTADLALLVVSAETGLTRQTRRHLLIVSALGVRHIVVAVNKMDVVGWSRREFAAVEAGLRPLMEHLGFDAVVFIPVAAASGDNVVSQTEHMGWYRGPSLLAHLEGVQTSPSGNVKPFRMPVQWVNRPHPGFRGYSGLIAGGEVHPGMPVQILPSGQRTTVQRIVTADGDLDRACAGQAVTLTLAGDRDVSRGDMIAEIGAPASVTGRFRARLVWMGEEPLTPGKPYLLRLAASTAMATVATGLSIIDPDRRKETAAVCLPINSIGTGIFELDRLVPVDRYADNKETGSFILIDRESYDTVGMGMIEEVLQARNQRPAQTGAALANLIRSTESYTRSIAKAASWRMTGSLDTFIIATFVTGSPKAAGAVALTEMLTKTALYYFHERIWVLVPWGKRASSLKRTRADDASQHAPNLVSPPRSSHSRAGTFFGRIQCKT
jgi:sulfate adenylyltransferase large subunit